MKLKSIIALIIMIASLWSAQIKIVTACQIRNSSDWRTSEKVGVAQEGETFEVLATYGDWVEVEVVKGKDKASTSDHVGKTGYMWAKRVSQILIGKATVIVEGVCLRSSPEREDNGTPEDPDDDPNLVAKVKKGAAIIIKSVVPTWYKIKGGWVSASCVEIID